MSGQQDILTEYFEDAMKEEKPKEVKLPEDSGLDFEIIEVFPEMPDEEEVVSFSEGDAGISDFTEFEEEMEDLDHEIEELEETVEDSIPGVSGPIIEDEVQDEEPEQPVETSWEKDRDVGKFMNYLRDNYANVPPHSGNSISGCERALKHFNALNKEISEAVRNDNDDVLGENLEEIEEFRVKILKGMVALKNRINQLRKKIQTTKKAETEFSGMMKEALTVEDGLVKEATTPRLQVVISAFERAVSGILVNAVVSAGNPFEDVYEYLKKKFDLTEREELAILQIVMDMGFPIFKDRGTVGEKEGEGSEDGQGVDFIKNYFS